MTNDAGDFRQPLEQHRKIGLHVRDWFILYNYPTTRDRWFWFNFHTVTCSTNIFTSLERCFFFFSTANPSLVLILEAVFSREAANANLIVFGFTRLWLEHTIYYTRGKHANYYTIDVVTCKSNLLFKPIFCNYLLLIPFPFNNLWAQKIKLTRCTSLSMLFEKLGGKRNNHKSSASPFM
jgi:hypothetical protein